jgi:glutamate-1-semialdehyde 2,1-aminomutase
MAIFDHTKGMPAVSHGGTFSANPLSMMAGLVALRAYDADSVARLNRLGDVLRRETSAGFDRRGLPAQLTGFGSLFRLHPSRTVIRDYRTCFQSAEQKGVIAAIHLQLLERGFLLTPNCSGALSTPMTESDIGDLAAAIVEAVVEIDGKTPWVRR